MPKQASINAFYVTAKGLITHIWSIHLSNKGEKPLRVQRYYFFLRYANFLDRMCGISAFCMQNII